jgi:hypothetical protein
MLARPIQWMTRKLMVRDMTQSDDSIVCTECADQVSGVA